MVEDRKIDLHLLRCLDVLLAERSVTRAAARMEMSQPGMSNALARLREAFGDPLLVRTPKGMEPTARAEEVRQTVREALHGIESALTGGSGFDPATASLNITIATTDYAAFVLFPGVLNRLEREAPGITITLRPPDPAHIREWLEEGAGELAIGFAPSLPDSLNTSTIYRDRLVCVARQDHPAIGDTVSRDTYGASRHVIFGSAFTGLSTLEIVLDDMLEHEGIVRQPGTRIPSALLSPHIVAATDMIATLPVRFVERFTDTLPLRAFELPFDAPEFPIAMIWHERTRQNEAMAWLREVIRQVAAEASR